jgi:hypothetical protein
MIYSPIRTVLGVIERFYIDPAFSDMANHINRTLSMPSWYVVSWLIGYVGNEGLDVLSSI